jgi:hypothetical protein
MKDSREVLDRMRRYNIKLQPDKCEFLRKEVCYLGHVIGSNGVKPDGKRIEAVKNFPEPRTTKELKEFLRSSRLLQKVYPQLWQNSQAIDRTINEERPIRLR